MAAPVPAVQQAVTAKAMYDCTEAMVVSNSGYTQQARKLAHANRVQLVGRDELVKMILATDYGRARHASCDLAALVVLAAIGVGKLLLAIRRQRRLARSRISEIDLMDGPLFERYLQTLFQRHGYQVGHIGSPRGDYGGDLMVRKNGTRTLVQAKRYSSPRRRRP